jgi:hypothetical protein
LLRKHVFTDLGMAKETVPAQERIFPDEKWYGSGSPLGADPRVWKKGPAFPSPGKMRIIVGVYNCWGKEDPKCNAHGWGQIFNFARPGQVGGDMLPWVRKTVHSSFLESQIFNFQGGRPEA